MLAVAQPWLERLVVAQKVESSNLSSQPTNLINLLIRLDDLNLED